MKNFTVTPRSDGTAIVEFPDGTQLKTPPATDHDKDLLLQKVAENWDSRCKHCDSVQQPLIRNDGRIVSQCAECNARRVLERLYIKLDDKGLRQLREDIHLSTERRLAVLNRVEATRDKEIRGEHV